MSNITSQSELTTKEIVEQAISDYHESILPYLNGMVPTIANKFDKANLYSTEEQIVGRWTDGKPLYQKTIELASALRFFLNGTWQNICDTPSTNLERLVDIKFNTSNDVKGFDAGISIINIVFYDSTTQKIKGWNIDGGSDYIEIKNITIQYTKTTDEAIEIGSDTDYSLEEKIIGTWIDGKPLYKKVVIVPSIAANAQFINILDSNCLIQNVNFLGAIYDNNWYSEYYYNASDYLSILWVRGGHTITKLGPRAYTNAYFVLEYTKTS